MTPMLSNFKNFKNSDKLNEGTYDDILMRHAEALKSIIAKVEMLQNEAENSGEGEENIVYQAVDSVMNNGRAPAIAQKLDQYIGGREINIQNLMRDLMNLANYGEEYTAQIHYGEDFLNDVISKVQKLKKSEASMMKSGENFFEVEDGVVEAVNEKKKSEKVFKVGDKATHKKHGVGRIVKDVEGLTKKGEVMFKPNDNSKMPYTLSSDDKALKGPGKETKDIVHIHDLSETLKHLKKFEAWGEDDEFMQREFDVEDDPEVQDSRNFDEEQMENEGGVETEISDDLKANFRSWEKDCDNQECFDNLCAIMSERHPNLEPDTIAEICGNWIGFGSFSEAKKEKEETLKEWKDKMFKKHPKGEIHIVKNTHYFFKDEDTCSKAFDSSKINEEKAKKHATAIFKK